MSRNYITKEEFDKYLATCSTVRESYDEAFSNLIEAIENLRERADVQEESIMECIKMLKELYRRYSERGGAKRFLDWTGSGNPLDPVNIGISLFYDD